MHRFPTALAVSGHSSSLLGSCAHIHRAGAPTHGVPIAANRRGNPPTFPADRGVSGRDKPKSHLAFRRHARS